MKTVAFALLLVLACGFSAFADTCVVAGYNTYLGTSCGINDKTFSNFTYSTAGSNPLPASSITVNPISTQYNPGFLFNAPWSAVGSQTQDSLIGFTANVNQGGNSIIDLSLNMFGGAVVGNGLVTVSETYCLGDTFADGCAGGTEGTLSTYLGDGLSKLSDSVSFANNPVRVVDVEKDIELLGGGNGGFAVLSGVSNQFSEVPEPGSLVLFGSGIVGLAGVLRRYVKL